MNIFLQTVHILGSVFLILVIILQSGRGGGMGTTFGGAAGQIFGGRGASNFLTRVTTGAAIFFFATAMTLSFTSSQHRSVVQQAESSRTNAPAKQQEASGAQGPQANLAEHTVPAEKAADAAIPPATQAPEEHATP